MGRSETARRKVLEAGLALLREGGVPAFTVEAISKRSGVAKTTIYRHWPGGAELLTDAVRSLIDPIPTPNTGSLRADLERLLEALMPRTQAELDERSRLMFSVLHTAADDPAVRDVVDRLLHERLTPVRTVIELARARGEVADDVDLDQALDIVEGPFLHRYLFRRVPLDAADMAGLLDHVVRALRAEPSEALRPGPSGARPA